MSTSGKVNYALTAFSKSIRKWTTIGLILFFAVGPLIWFCENHEFPLFVTSSFVFSLGQWFLGLALIGEFLRQTARIIVEGLGGNTNEERIVKSSKSLRDYIPERNTDSVRDAFDYDKG